MRALLLIVLAAVLAVPAVAIADRGSDGSSRSASRLGRFVDDEREVKGRILSLAPLRVGRLTCVVPSRLSVSAFRVGDFVEATCDRVRGQWVLRRLKLEDDNEVGDDERELTARIVSLSPLSVGSLTCLVPRTVSLTGFRVGDLVEITCDRIRGQWVLRRLKHEDRDDDDDRIGRTDNSDPGNGGGDHDDDHSGPGHGDGGDDGSGSGGSGPG